MNYRYILLIIIVCFWTYPHPIQSMASTMPSDTSVTMPVIPDTKKEKSELAAQIAQVDQKAQMPEPDLIELYFENSDFGQLVTQIEHIFDVKFITDETIAPAPDGTKTLKGNKITFRTSHPISKEQVWNIFVTFARIAGFAIVQEPTARVYRILPIDVAKKSPLPAFIGTDPDQLPDSDQLIRYVYFIEYGTLETIVKIVDTLKSASATLLAIPEIKGFLIIDQSYNIKSLMRIVKELDKVTMPQAMSVLKLRRADAADVEKLYKELIPQEDKSVSARLTQRKKTTAAYFPETVRLIAEPRTNSLILLGPTEAIKRIEQFIISHVDVEIDMPYSLLQVHQLKYAEAETIAKIMNDVVQFGKGTAAGQVGGVRSGDKYLGQLTFTAEPKTNRLIIRGEYEDYLKVKEIIEQLDKEAAQVAIEVLVLAVSITDNKELGTQLRSNENNGNGLLGNNIKFQTSGLFAGGSAKGIVENTNGSGVQRLLGDLINLVTRAPAGNTILSLGQDAFGVWGIVQALKTISNTEVLANLFLSATNKTKAEVSNGETRRVVTGTILGTNSTNTFGDDKAELKVKVIPQINSDGMIILNLDILLTAFLPGSDQVNVAKTERQIVTETIVADKEVLALGGLVQNKINTNENKVPILGDIPILGWLFKNRSKSEDKTSLLILVSTRIVEAQAREKSQEFTQEKVRAYHAMLDPVSGVANHRDPVDKIIFADAGSTSRIIDDFLFQRRSRTKRRDKRMRPRTRASKVRPEDVGIAGVSTLPKASKPPVVPPAATSIVQHTPVINPSSSPIVTADNGTFNHHALREKKRAKRSLTDMLTESKGIRS